VAGIIAGKGSESNGKYIGVAPKANLLNVRVADDQGMLYESDVVDSLQWVYNNKDKYNIRVVNLSLNSTVAQSYHTSPLSAAVEILWFNGIVVVVSAGNNGTGTIFPPANDPFVITVGATDDRGTVSTADDTMATFSAYGITESGFAKPDLVAPGRMIIGLLPDNDKLNMGRSHSSNRLDTTYFKMSGTSVSAPMVSGAVAILLQDEPNLTPDQVKYRLMATADKNWAGYDAASAGAGYLNIYNAVYGTTTESANTGLSPSQLLITGTNPILWSSVGWNSVGWNSVGWNSVGWNSVGWNSVGWNSDDWTP
jgi:serine protease AprX